jgi:hypothetical protein
MMALGRFFYVPIARHERSKAKRKAYFPDLGEGVTTLQANAKIKH